MEDNADRYEVVKTTYLSTELHQKVLVVVASWCQMILNVKIPFCK